MLEKFSHIDLSGKGHITLEEFSKYLQVPVSESLKEVYDMYDRVSSHYLSFVTRNRSFQFPTRSDINQAVELQKMTRCLKFCM